MSKKMKRTLSVFIALIILIASLGLQSLSSVGAVSFNVSDYEISDISAVYVDGVGAGYTLKKGVFKLSGSYNGNHSLQIYTMNGDEYSFVFENDTFELLGCVMGGMEYKGACVGLDRDKGALRMVHMLSSMGKPSYEISYVGALVIKSGNTGEVTLSNKNRVGYSRYKYNENLQMETVVKNIEAQDYGTKYLVRPYMIIKHNGKKYELYGNVTTVDFYSVALKSLNEESRDYSVYSDKFRIVSKIINANGYHKNSYIADDSVWNTEKFNWSPLTLTLDTVGARDIETIKNTIDAFKLGVYNHMVTQPAIGEWGYSFLHLNGHIDGANRLIESGYDGYTVNTRADALNIIKDFVYRQYSVSADKKWSSVNGYYNWQHYGARFGADMVGSEIGENISGYQMHIAFTRGAARQYGKKWFMDFSFWYNRGMLDYGNTLAWNQGGKNKGHSLNLAERVMVMNYLAGSATTLIEGGAPTTMYDYDSNGDGYYDITPFGQICGKFNNFALNNLYVGTAYTPFALVLDEYHGIEAGWTNFNGYTNKAFGKFNYNNGDYMTKNIMSIFFGDSVTVSADTSTDNNESKFMTNLPLADSVDVLLQDASLKTLNSYPCVLLSGDIKFTAEQVKNYTDYCKQGGTLILNTAYLSSFAEINAEYQLSGKEEIKCGNGKVIIYGGDYQTTSLPAILNNLYNRFSFIKQTGNVQKIITLADNCMYVALINNRGVEKATLSAAVIDNSVNDEITLSCDGTPRIKKVTDIYNAHSLKVDNNTVSLNLTAGDIAVLKIEF